MPINRKMKLLFIHNPKCGGSSMEKFFGMTNKSNRFDKKNLSGLHNIQVKDKIDLNPMERTRGFKNRSYNKPVQHLTPEELIKDGYISEKEFNENFSFTFVRNPWDKVISSYESYFKKLYPNFDIFLLWVKEMVDKEKDGSYFVFDDKNRRSINTHFKEQHKFVLIDGSMAINFLGRYENINEDFKTLCELINVKYKPLEKVNVTAKKKHYSTYYNEEQMKLVGEIYKADIELFNYKFEKLGN